MLVPLRHAGAAPVTSLGKHWTHITGMTSSSGGHYLFYNAATGTSVSGICTWGFSDKFAQLAADRMVEYVVKEFGR